VGLQFSTVTFISFYISLKRGQIAGLTGKAVTRGTVQVVIACDPAGPLFNFSNPSERVADTDAVHVEVVHTNIANLGMREPVGHADFYPNFGRTQPVIFLFICYFQFKFITFNLNLGLWK
jgi:Lipase